jgi:hypothetical protein
VAGAGSRRSESFRICLSARAGPQALTKVGITARRTPGRHRSTCYSDSRRARSCGWRSERSHTARSGPSTSRGSPKRSHNRAHFELFRRSSGTWPLRRSCPPRPPIQEPHGRLGPSHRRPRCHPRDRRIRSFQRRPRDRRIRSRQRRPRARPIRPCRSRPCRCHRGLCRPPRLRPRAPLQHRCRVHRCRRLANHRSHQPRFRPGRPSSLPPPPRRRPLFHSPRRRRGRPIPNHCRRPPVRAATARRRTCRGTSSPLNEPDPVVWSRA